MITFRRILIARFRTWFSLIEKGRHTHYDFYLYNSNIETVQSFKYLGIHLYKNGNWNRSQKLIVQRASYSLHKLFIICNQIQLPIKEMISLFVSLVQPILNYGAEVWGHDIAPEVEHIHTKFLRKILVLKRSVHLETLYGEVGRYSMAIFMKRI